MSSLLEPASGVNVGGVGIDPEVVALGIPIKVQPQAVATHLAPSGGITGTPMAADTHTHSLTSHAPPGAQVLASAPRLCFQVYPHLNLVPYSFPTARAVQVLVSPEFWV